MQEIPTHTGPHIPQIKFHVVGEVQGVNFRRFVSRQARSIGLTGWVSNHSDGSVRGEAQGSERQIQDFVPHLYKGPEAASVKSVNTDDIDSKGGEEGFVVK
ncbi:Acylphosphatase [Aaosphaeria arxii CBS 175.79]|uniref:acylphosphatase n=1 Tax=Aaosphaeria arxii CBS 175.79 TaxID=1450172 RepID=A0A6A5X6A0_9PLEO|nr:Acylphosphatase [Aaosphaeria arxii CBS 175.79]KAF2008535.1 Acylphosphatase [Aaosphaeria arxii CBS 175.79]